MIGGNVHVGAMVAVSEDKNIKVGKKVEVEDGVTVFSVATAVAVPADTDVIDAEKLAIELLISSNDKVDNGSIVGLASPARVPIKSKAGSEAESGCG